MSDRESWIGVGSFTLGGMLLFFGAYPAIESANKVWIDKWLFTGFFVMPIVLMAFFLLGLELLLIVRSSKGGSSGRV